jgi:hypothetical protein
MKHITSCFSDNLIDLCHRSFQSEKWKEMVSDYLSAPLKNHVYVGEFKQGVLTLIVDCPLWNNQLRMVLPELRDKIRSEQKCYELRSINVKVAPDFFKGMP